MLCGEGADGQSVFRGSLSVTVKSEGFLIVGLQKIKFVVFPSLPEVLKSQINFFFGMGRVVGLLGLPPDRLLMGTVTAYDSAACCVSIFFTEPLFLKIR